MITELSKTKVNSRFESNSQLLLLSYAPAVGCQRPKLIQDLKAIHNIADYALSFLELSKTKVNSRFESNSQLMVALIKMFYSCQRPKLIQDLKAIHNSSPQC